LIYPASKPISFHCPHLLTRGLSQKLFYNIIGMEKIPSGPVLKAKKTVKVQQVISKATAGG
jgi:hypothetical protein